MVTFINDKNFKAMEVKIIRSNGAELPKYGTAESSGADVRCMEDFTLAPMQRKMIHTGLFMELPKGVEAQVRPRSGLALKHGITVLNSPGTIDADYRGECNVILINLGDETLIFKKGERIAQFVFQRVEQATFREVQTLSDSDRGEGGFGSTGKE